MVDESRKETADRVARYQTDYVVGRTCLSYSYHKLLRLCRRCLWCASVSLFFPSALGHILFMLQYFVLSVTFPRGGYISFFCIYSGFICFFCFFVPFVFLPFDASKIASICMSYLSYPVRWQLIALSTLLTALQCSISVSWFSDHRACISLGGRISTDTGCARCRPVERTVSCEEHIHNYGEAGKKDHAHL